VRVRRVLQVSAAKREATVVALEDCYLIALTRDDMEGLPVDLRSVRANMCRHMLRKVHSHGSHSARTLAASVHSSRR
jgi:CRP-like cAMP-binding protein